MLSILKKQEKSFDIIFADPPYNKLYSEKVIRWVDENVVLKPSGSLFIEESPEVKLEELLLQMLQLKSHRKMGSTLLLEYELKQDG